jgi:hypothetical protein
MRKFSVSRGAGRVGIAVAAFMMERILRGRNAGVITGCRRQVELRG